MPTCLTNYPYQCQLIFAGYNSITSRSLKDQSLVWIIIGCDGARIDDQLSNRYCCCCCSTLNFLNSMTPKRYQFFPLAFASFNLSQLVPSKVTFLLRGQIESKICCVNLSRCQICGCRDFSLSLFLQTYTLSIRLKNQMYFLSYFGQIRPIFSVSLFTAVYLHCFFSFECNSQCLIVT